MALGRATTDWTIDHTDSERKAYLRRFHEVAKQLPTHYDVVINTDTLSPEAAVRTILAAAGAEVLEAALATA